MRKKIFVVLVAGIIASQGSLWCAAEEIFVSEEKLEENNMAISVPEFGDTSEEAPILTNECVAEEMESAMSESLDESNEEVLQDSNNTNSTEEDFDIGNVEQLITDGAENAEALFESGTIGTDDIYNVVDFGANGSDQNDDAAAIIAALDKARISKDYVEVYVPAGTYYIERGLPIYSNTTLTLDTNATIVSTNNKNVMIYGKHLNDDGAVCPGDASCKHNGYSQLQNVIIQGGTWDRNDKTPETDNTIMLLRHGQNITIQNLTCKNGGYHYINLSGVNTATLKNVSCINQHLGNQETDSSEDWQSKTNKKEALHFDFIGDEGEATGYPVDGTAPKNITVIDCTFKNLYSAIGTHHLTAGEHANTILIKNSSFNDIIHHCINAYNYEDVNIVGNEFNNVGKLVYAVKSNLVINENIINNTVSHAIHICENSTALVRDNEIRDAGAVGIRANDYSDLTASNNIIISPAGNGIDTADYSTLNASGNIVTKSAIGICITNNCTGCIVKSNQIKNTAGNAIYIYNNASATLTDNVIEAAGATGIRISNGSSATLQKNTVTLAKAAGICIDKNSILTAENNEISKAGQDGIYVSDRCTLTTTGNLIEEVTGNGIYVSDGCQVTAERNVITKAGSVGIRARNNCNVLAKTNKISTPKISGISVDKSSILTADSNQVANAGQDGIYVADNTNLVALGNTIEDCAAGVSVINSCTDCVLSGNTITRTKGNGIYISNGSGVKAENNIISKAGKAGIRANNNCNVTAKSNMISASGTNAVDVSSNTVLNARGNKLTDAQIAIAISDKCVKSVIDNNTIQNTTGHAIYLANSCEGKIKGNKIIGAENAGIRADKSTIDIQNNTITKPKTTGIAVSGGIFDISNNTIYSAGNQGIYVYLCTDSSITENKVTEAGGVGIYLYGMKSSTVKGNTVQNSRGHGIQAEGSNSNICTVEISDNTAITSGVNRSDIRLGVWCKNCVVKDNTIGNSGFTVDKTSTCTASNNKKLHTHKWIVIIDKEATCGKTGIKHLECSCGEKQSSAVIEMTGKHRYNSWSVTRKASVLRTGVKTRTCKICKKKENKSIAKLTPTIKLSVASIPLKIKQTYTIKISGLAYGDKVKSWKSSNIKVATVNSKGTITGKKVGKAIITVKLASGLSKKVTVKVQKTSVKTTKLSVNYTTYVLKKGKTFKLKAVLTPVTSKEAIKYSSSNKKVALVNSEGVVKGIKKGTVTITIQSGSKKVKCKVTVK